MDSSIEDLFKDEYIKKDIKNSIDYYIKENEDVSTLKKNDAVKLLKNIDDVLKYLEPIILAISN